MRSRSGFPPRAYAWPGAGAGVRETNILSRGSHGSFALLLSSLGIDELLLPDWPTCGAEPEAGPEVGLVEFESGPGPKPAPEPEPELGPVPELAGM